MSSYFTTSTSPYIYIYAVLSVFGSLKKLCELNKHMDVFAYYYLKKFCLFLFSCVHPKYIHHAQQYTQCNGGFRCSPMHIFAVCMSPISFKKCNFQIK